MPPDHLRQHLAPCAIRFVEPREHRAVEIEHTYQCAANNQRHHQFGARRGIACDVAREGFDVRHKDGTALRRGGTADASAEGDTHTGWSALEGPQHQLATPKKVEPDPIQLGQRVIDGRGRVGSIGDGVRLIRNQRAKLACQFVIQCGQVLVALHR